VLNRGRECRGGEWGLGGDSRPELKCAFTDGHNKKRLEVRNSFREYLTILHRRHRVFITSTNRLKLFRQTTHVYCKNYMENNLRGKDVELWNVKHGGARCSNCTL